MMLLKSLFENKVHDSIHEMIFFFVLSFFVLSEKNDKKVSKNYYGIPYYCKYCGKNIIIFSPLICLNVHLQCSSFIHNVHLPLRVTVTSL